MKDKRIRNEGETWRGVNNVTIVKSCVTLAECEVPNFLENFKVMKSHSRKWLENIIMGSVTEKILHNISIPLFVIPTKKQN